MTLVSEKEKRGDKKSGGRECRSQSKGMRTDIFFGAVFTGC